MQEKFKAISISYHKADLALREKISLSETEVKSFYIKLKDILDIKEALIISTCNRTEVYYVNDNDLSKEIIKLLAVEKGVDTTLLFSAHQSFVEHKKALEYLFEVSIGLHSQVLGDNQLPKQIKDAYQWSADANMAGPFLHRLMHTIFFANKRVVQETEFRDGAASTSYATVDLMEGFLPLLKEPKILLIGLGEVGRDVCQTLADKGYSNITLCNRDLKKSRNLASKYDFDFINFDKFEENFKNFQIIISSVRVESPLLTKELWLSKKNKGISYLFDLSVPRSISSEIGQENGVVLYDLDEIQKRTSKTLNKRLESIPKIKKIILESLEEFSLWSKETELSPTIHKLKSALEQIRKEEISKFLKELNQEEVEKVEKITSSIIQKVIKLPVLQLKAACKRGDAENLIDVLNDLFDLEKTNSPVK